MATVRKTAAKKPAAKKPAARKAGSGITKAKVKRVARKAKASLDEAAHDANLALRRTGRSLKRGAAKLEAKIEEAKGPAKRRAKRVQRKVVAAVESAGESLGAFARKAKRTLKSLSGGTGKPPARKPVAARKTAKKAAAR